MAVEIIYLWYKLTRYNPENPKDIKSFSWTIFGIRTFIKCPDKNHGAIPIWTLEGEFRTWTRWRGFRTMRDIELDIREREKKCARMCVCVCVCRIIIKGEKPHAPSRKIVACPRGISIIVESWLDKSSTTVGNHRRKSRTDRKPLASVRPSFAPPRISLSAIKVYANLD